MRRTIGIISGKGGVGKTTITLNLGYAMHNLGEDIVVMDGNLKNPNFGIHLGLFEYGTTLQDVLEKNMLMIDALHIHESGLRFIPAHLSLHYLNVDATKLKEALGSFESQVLIDSPPGLDSGVISVLEACNEVIIVSAPYLPDLTDCMKTIQIAREMGIGIRGIVLNSVRKKEYEISHKEIEAATGVPILQVIPWDENVLRALAMKTPVLKYNPYTPASVAFYELASRLSDKQYKKPMLLWLRKFLSG